MNRISRTASPAVLMLALAASVVAAQEPQITVSLVPNPIGVGELVTLSIDVEGGGLGGFDLEPRFALENLEVLSGPSRSQNFSFVNGRTSRSETLVWRLAAHQEGTARVVDIELKVRAKVFRLGTREVQVQRDPVGPPPQSRRRPIDPMEEFFDPFRRRSPTSPSAGREPKVLIRAEVSNLEPWVGEQVVYSLMLLSQVDISRVNPEEIPDFAGFWTHEIPPRERLSPEMVEIDGERFAKVPLLERAIFPLRSGEITLEAARTTLIARVPDPGIFGSFFGRTQEIVRVSQPLTLRVKALPAAPAGYQGAVGQLKLAAELTPTTLEVGEAASLTLTLSGAGHLQGLPEPPIPALPGLEAFPPQRESAQSLRGTTLEGVRSWIWVLVPKEQGLWVLPDFEVPYFDPRAGEFRVARAAGGRLTAHLPESPDTPVSLPTSPEDVAQHPRPPQVAAAGKAWLPWAAGAAVILGLIGLASLWRRRDHGPARHRKGLHAALRRAASADRARMAAAAIEEGWREYLAARWQIGRGSPSTRWAALLVEAGASSAAAEGLVTLADDLHYLRYAPQLSATESLVSDLIRRSRKLLKILG